jgi:hypothetical protein
VTITVGAIVYVFSPPPPSLPIPLVCGDHLSVSCTAVVNDLASTDIIFAAVGVGAIVYVSAAAIIA